MKQAERLWKAARAYLARQPRCQGELHVSGFRNEIPPGPCARGVRGKIALWCQGPDDQPTLCDECADFFRAARPDECCVTRRQDYREILELIDASSAEGWSSIREQRP